MKNTYIEAPADTKYEKHCLCQGYPKKATHCEALSRAYLKNTAYIEAPHVKACQQRLEQALVVSKLQNSCDLHM